MELIAAAVNVDATAYHNDSKLEEKLLYTLKNMTAQAGTATTLLPAARSVAQVAGGKNI